MYIYLSGSCDEEVFEHCSLKFFHKRKKSPHDNNRRILSVAHHHLITSLIVAKKQLYKKRGFFLWSVQQHLPHDKKWTVFILTTFATTGSSPVSQTKCYDYHYYCTHYFFMSAGHRGSSNDATTTNCWWLWWCMWASHTKKNCNSPKMIIILNRKIFRVKTKNEKGSGSWRQKEKNRLMSVHPFVRSFFPPLLIRRFFLAKHQKLRLSQWKKLNRWLLRWWLCEKTTCTHTPFFLPSFSFSLGTLCVG